MYKTSPINKNKVLSGLQNFTFDEIENYRTHVFEKHSVMDDTKNLDLVLRGKKQTQSCFIADINNPGDTNANVKYAKEIISNAIMDNSSKYIEAILHCVISFKYNHDIIRRVFFYQVFIIIEETNTYNLTCVI